MNTRSIIELCKAIDKSTISNLELIKHYIENDKYKAIEHINSLINNLKEV